MQKRNLATLLKNRLASARKVVVLGVGSELRADDAAGLMVCRALKNPSKDNKLSRRLKVVFGETAPENMTGLVRRLKPTHVIIVDCADISKKAGAIALIEHDAVKGVSFSTHQLPMEIMAGYLERELNCDVIVIGIQPKTIKFGAPVSGAVKKAALKLAREIEASLKKG